MELHQLRYFVAVVRHGSFTRAAEHEHVAQPSLSQQIRKLEDELGTRLFDRLGRKIRLTQPGQNFLPHARRVLEEVEGARQGIGDLLGLRQGSVSLGVIPTVAPYLLPSVLSSFARRAPNISVSVREDLTHALLQQLVEGELDLAVLGVPVDRPELWIAEPLLKEPMLLAVPTHHRLWRRRRPVEFREVAHEPFLLLKDGHCFRDDVLRICQESRVKPKVVFEGGQFDTLVALVAAGAGVTLLPQMARRRYQRAGVGLLEFKPPQPRRTLGIVRSREKFVTPAARAFVEVLRKVPLAAPGGQCGSSE